MRYESGRAAALGMILLDTNVVSEAMKPAAHPSVREWLDAQVAETLFLSIVTMVELSFGIEALPEGRRRDNLAAALDGVLGLFGGRILAFDLLAARRYGALPVRVRARAARREFPTPDGYIAAIAAAQGFAVASRDASGLAAARLVVIDPWTVRS